MTGLLLLRAVVYPNGTAKEDTHKCAISLLGTRLDMTLLIASIQKPNHSFLLSVGPVLNITQSSQLAMAKMAMPVVNLMPFMKKIAQSSSLSDPLLHPPP